MGKKGGVVYNQGMEEVDGLAKIIWDYMLMRQSLRACEAVFVLGSIDERVGEYGAQLFLDGYGERLILSGGNTHSTKLLTTAWEGSEAAHFADIAVSMGVPKEKILIEDRATNTGENITFTKRLLDQMQLSFKSYLLVQKPYMERRTYATFAKQWPDASTGFLVSSPPIAYDDYFDEQNPKQEIINIMVGDLQRIREYPKLGYQTEQDIPAEVWGAYEALVELGYTKHLINIP